MNTGKEKKTSIKVNYIYNLSYQILAIIAPLITTPYVSRVLGASGIGIYSYTLSIVTYFTMFGALGLGTLGQLKIAQTQKDNTRELSKKFWEIQLSRTILTGIAILLYFVFCYFQESYRPVYYILILNLIGSIFDISWFFQGLEEFKKTTIRNFVIKIVSIVLIFLFVRESSDLYIYIIILQGSILIGNASLWLYLIKTVKTQKIDFHNVISHWKASIPYFIPTVAVSIYTVLDKAMIGWITGSSYENGYYEQAYKIQQLAVTVVTALSVVTMPRAASLYAENKRDEIKDLVSTSVRFTFLLGLPISFGLFSIADTLIPWFLGDGYEPCVLLLRIMSLMVLFVGIDNLIGKECLIACNKQKYYNYGVILGAVLNMVMNAFLIPLLGSTGAAIASVVAEFMIMASFIYFCRNTIDFKSAFIQSWKYWIASAVMCVTVYGIGRITGATTMGIFIQIVTGVVIYFSLLLLMRDEMVYGALKGIISRISSK